MPYYLYRADNLPRWQDGQTKSRLDNVSYNGTPFEYADAEHLRVFDDAKTANACRLHLNKGVKAGRAIGQDLPDWPAVVFVPLLRDMEEWRVRESKRLRGELPAEHDKDGVLILYRQTPWQTDDWYRYLNDGDYNYGLQHRHYAHMSRVMPGQVAFTPSEEYGVQNRKVRMTVARYLDKFARYSDGTLALTSKEIARYVALVKAYANQTVKLATTADEIIAVYCCGPSSCMSHEADHYSSGIHPVAAYAGSDLAVAYCGDPKDGVSARSVVWPEKKIYTRIYGDATLEHILRGNGYERGTLGGATIPARQIDGSSDWLMPYIDAADSADLVMVGGWQVFRLRDSDDGEWLVKVTAGIAEPAEPEHEYHCAHCEDTISERTYNNHGGYCQSCEDDRWVCTSCNEASFDSDDASSVDGEYYCNHCYNRMFSTCKYCGEEYRKDRNRSSKRDRAVLDYCDDCSDDKMECDDCGGLVDNDPDNTTCKDCRGEEEIAPVVDASPAKDTKE